MGRRKEIKELYYIRAIAAIGILVIHATASFAVYSEFGSKAMYLGIFLNQFFRFGSPVFMMVSGLVIFYNYRSIDEFNTRRFLKKKIEFVLVPYTIWSAIYYFYPYLIRKTPIYLETFISFGQGLLLGSNYSHLYFITLIFQFYLVVPLLIKYLAKPMQESPLKVFAFFFVFQALFLIYLYYYKSSHTSGILGFLNNYGWKTLFSWSSYFMTGGLIGMHYDKFVAFINKNIKSLTIGFLITTFLYVGQVFYNIWIHGSRNFYDNFGSIRPHTMIYVLFTMPILIFLTRKIVGNPKFKFLKDFGIYSFGVYFSHPLILLVILRLMIGYLPSYFGYSRLSTLVLVCGLGLGATFLFVILVGSLSIRGLFIGKVEKYAFTNKKSAQKS
ncbi:MAG: acyltransferase [Tissierellia bacterium]|nr:acyltransferase [Tissierellia bacterium]MDD4725868.1 acyltransferase [Tissierellia bacterium]